MGRRLRLCGALLALGSTALLPRHAAGESPEAPAVAICLLSDSTMSVADAAKLGLDSLSLAEPAFLTSDGITAYSWAHHAFRVTPEALLRLKALEQRPYMSQGRPFVMVAGGERIYLGAFWYAYSSLAPTVPHIQVAPLSLNIARAWAIPESTADVREDPRIYRLLKAAGILEE